MHVNEVVDREQTAVHDRARFALLEGLQFSVPYSVQGEPTIRRSDSMCGDRFIRIRIPRLTCDRPM